MFPLLIPELGIRQTMNKIGLHTSGLITELQEVMQLKYSTVSFDPLGISRFYKFHSNLFFCYPEIFVSETAASAVFFTPNKPETIMHIFKSQSVAHSGLAD